jgi:hypothetical protein
MTSSVMLSCVALVRTEFSEELSVSIDISSQRESVASYGYRF